MRATAALHTYRLRSALYTRNNNRRETTTLLLPAYTEVSLCKALETSSKECSGLAMHLA